ncbi:hypothetical protein EMGBS8_19480 [Verrucomicrobiota bacterium]|nr:hypothetical protein EMGBS8_19480 [Verrucomicrobiota bacterium]
MNASRTLGAGHLRILWKHILPNCATVILTTLRSPCTDSSSPSLPSTTSALASRRRSPHGVTSCTKAARNWRAWWILTPALACLVGLMVMINSIGEGLKKLDIKRVQK